MAHSKSGSKKLKYTKRQIKRTIREHSGKEQAEVLQQRGEEVEVPTVPEMDPEHLTVRSIRARQRQDRGSSDAISAIEGLVLAESFHAAPALQAYVSTRTYLPQKDSIVGASMSLRIAAFEQIRLKSLPARNIPLTAKISEIVKSSSKDETFTAHGLRTKLKACLAAIDKAKIADETKAILRKQVTTVQAHIQSIEPRMTVPIE